MKLPGRAITKLLLTLLPLALLLQNCSTPAKPADNYLPPLKINIPNDAQNDSVLVSFIISSENNINKLSNRFEDIASTIQNYTDDPDMFFLDKIKYTRLSIQLYNTANDLNAEADNIEKFIEKKQEEGMSSTDISTYLAVRNSIQQRLNQLKEKYQNVLNYIKSTNYENH